MNRAAASVMTDTATVWPKGTQDQFGNISYGTPFTIGCNYRQGGKLTRDTSTGDEFAPSATFRTFTAQVQRGDKIAVGDLTANSTPEGQQAYSVREVLTKSPFRGWLQRYDIMTG